MNNTIFLILLTVIHGMTAMEMDQSANNKQAIKALDNALDCAWTYKRDSYPRLVIARLGLAQLIIDQEKVDVNALFDKYAEPLIIKYVGFPEAVALLIKNGADVNIKARDGAISLHELAQLFTTAYFLQSLSYLILNDYKSSFAKLWLARSNNNEQDEDGNTPLMSACKTCWSFEQLEGTIEFTQLLLKPLVLFEKNTTYFHLLEPHLRGQIKRRLMNLRLKNHNGNTALAIAQIKLAENHKEIVTHVLQEAINKQWKSGWDQIVYLIQMAQKNQ